MVWVKVWGQEAGSVYGILCASALNLMRLPALSLMHSTLAHTCSTHFQALLCEGTHFTGLSLSGVHGVEDSAFRRMARQALPPHAVAPASSSVGGVEGVGRHELDSLELVRCKSLTCLMLGLVPEHGCHLPLYTTKQVR